MSSSIHDTLVTYVQQKLGHTQAEAATIVRRLKYQKQPYETLEDTVRVYVGNVLRKAVEDSLRGEYRHSGVRRSIPYRHAAYQENRARGDLQNERPFQHSWQAMLAYHRKNM